MFIRLNSIQPAAPSATGCWVRPATIVLQDSSQTNHPWSELDIDEGDLRTEKERTLWIALLDDLGYFILQLLGVFCLLAEFLSLEKLIESWNDSSIDLVTVSYTLRRLLYYSRDRSTTSKLLGVEDLGVEGQVQSSDLPATEDVNNQF
jgi:hypothetical protein